MTPQLSLYNSLTRQKEPFIPIDENDVKMYVCGPTVYSYAHIGNARAAVVFDTLRRVLEHYYPKVTHVANITDIDDKIIDAAKKEGKPIEEITDYYTSVYNDDMAALGVKIPTIQPRATDHVIFMILMIERLLDKGHAYERDGHVLFHVPYYPAYGRLSGRDRDEQIAGARVEVAPYKKDPADFVLWKPSTDDQPGWDSPWGRGRPGWHIECSVMAQEYLGDVFDIHGGGLDLTFPHHENEIAQTCCATGRKEMARYWVHNGFLSVEGDKMSKSLGNVVITHDLIEDGIPGEAIRLALLSTHYRQPLNWTADNLNQAIKTLDKWYDILATTPQTLDKPHDKVVAALADDMNTPLAIAALHKIAKDHPQELAASARLIGFLNETADTWRHHRHAKHNNVPEQVIDNLIRERNDARANRDFQRADEIRDELAAMGITIKDGPNGTEWSYSP